VAFSEEKTAIPEPNATLWRARLRLADASQTLQEMDNSSLNFTKISFTRHAAAGKLSAL